MPRTTVALRSEVVEMDRQKKIADLQKKLYLERFVFPMFSKIY